MTDTLLSEYTNHTARYSTMAKQTKKPSASARKRTRYNAEYKAEALKLADRIGVTEAAAQLGIHEALIYNWRGIAKVQLGLSARETSLATENAKLKRQLAEQMEELAILKKAAAYFAKHQK